MGWEYISSLFSTKQNYEKLSGYTRNGFNIVVSIFWLLFKHLATFPVEGVKTEHVVTEAEKKLRHYETNERLWPQNLVMRVDEFHLQLETPDEESPKGWVFIFV